MKKIISLFLILTLLVVATACTAKVNEKTEETVGSSATSSSVESSAVNSGAIESGAIEVDSGAIGSAAVTSSAGIN